MAGGSGSRLWPLSRAQFPKQFLPLVGEQSMLQDTCARLKGLEHQPPVFICGEDHRFIVAEQLREASVGHGGILLEPAGRNTAPAIALSALHALASGVDPLLLVLAADHVILDVPAFQASVNQATAFAEDGKLVTFGIVADAPETGYGYIKRGKRLSAGADSDSGSSFLVEAFVEKPDLATAEEYLASGLYDWNSGMFLFKASTYLSVLQNHQPAMYAACVDAMNGASNDTDFIRPEAKAFLSCPDDSIDYAVMEKAVLDTAAASVVAIPMDCGWSDVGSWSALWDVAEKDENGNALHGDVLLEDSRNCLLHSQGKLVAVVGLDNVVVVETDDAIMVAAKDRVQDVKKIVAQLKQGGRAEAVANRKVFRPWGYYDCIDHGERFQAKRIVVKPGSCLSLQMHHHRAEHWIVVSGTAEVTRGDDVFLVSENESTYIPLGTKHRLKNPGAIDLEMIEVQSGSYLGEDDIVRFEDTYGRS